MGNKIFGYLFMFAGYFSVLIKPNQLIRPVLIDIETRRRHLCDKVGYIHLVQVLKIDTLNTFDALVCRQQVAFFFFLQIVVSHNTSAKIHIIFLFYCITCTDFRTTPIKKRIKAVILHPKLQTATTMTKKDENLEAQQAAEAADNAAAETQTPSETPNRDKWLANMRGKYGEDKSEEELYDLSSKGYDEEHEYAKQQRADIDAFTNSIKDYPELAAFYSEAAAGNIGSAILNLGDLMEAYRKGEINDEKYRNAVAERKAADDEKNSKIAAQNEVFEKWCKDKGYDPEEWITKAEEALFKPMASYALAEAQFDAIDKMLNYDEDVEAAKVQGRNENIVTQRKKSAAATDGQVNGGSASAGAAEPAKPSRMSQIAKNREYARNL